MRPQVRDFVRLVSEHFPIQDPIYEFGSRQPPGQEEIANLRLLFEKRKLLYVGCDMHPGSGVDCLENLHSLSIEPESIGTVLCLETLEHVEDCRLAVNEMFRVLKPGGLIVISSGMNEIIHKSPNDYWRFAPDGFESLLKQFTYRYVVTLGLSFFPSTVIGIGFKGEPFAEEDVSTLRMKVDKWRQRWKKREISAKQVAKLFLPSGLLLLYRRLRFGREDAVNSLRR